MLFDATDDVCGAFDAPRAVLLHQPTYFGCVRQARKLGSETEPKHGQETHVVLALDVLPKIFLNVRVLNPAQFVCFGARFWPSRSAERAPPAEHPTGNCADTNQHDESDGAQCLELHAREKPNEIKLSDGHGESPSLEAKR